MRELLIVFARYPEVGKCKTRLIGALTAEEASALHEQMVHHTVRWALELESRRSELQVQVHFFGGDARLMQDRFGPMEYHVQVDGDLGQKMQAAFKRGIDAGFERVVVVGTDCPQLNSKTISRVFDMLDTVDVSIVPASDGGYVALGVNASRSDEVLPAVFTDKPWGTEEVYGKTLDSLADLEGLKVALLPPHDDVDYPEDVQAGRRFLEGYKAPETELSVLIPVWGDEQTLSRCISAAQDNADEQSREQLEIIVTARGAWRAVADVGHVCRATVVCAGAENRGQQLNHAVLASVGKYLCVLHADTYLPQGFDLSIRQVLQNERNVAGAFSLAIAKEGWGFRLVEIGVSFRCRFLSLPYGDQAIFTRRTTLGKIGGFDEVPIMEDYRLIKQLQKLGKIEVLNSRVETSARRWQELGVIKTTVINQLMLVGHKFGISPERLAQFYRGAAARDNKDVSVQNGDGA